MSGMVSPVAFAAAFAMALSEPNGRAVKAGREWPDAALEMLRNPDSNDRTVAERSRQIVMFPPRLPSSAYNLTLRPEQPEGKASSEQTVGVVLELNPNRAVVALITPDKPIAVLSHPAAPKAVARILVVDVLETEPGGKLHVSGQAPPDASLW